MSALKLTFAGPLGGGFPAPFGGRSRRQVYISSQTTRPPESEEGVEIEKAKINSGLQAFRQIHTRTLCSLLFFVLEWCGFRCFGNDVAWCGLVLGVASFSIWSCRQKETTNQQPNRLRVLEVIPSYVTDMKSCKNEHTNQWMKKEGQKDSQRE